MQILTRKKWKYILYLNMDILKKVTEDELWGTFNMGVGFVVIVKKEDAEKTNRYFEGKRRKCL